MKRLTNIFVLLLMILSMGIIVKADDDTCTKEELTRLKELAKKVEINYDYVLKEAKQNGEVIKYPDYFTLTATNLNSDLKVMIIENYYEGKYKEFTNGLATEATLKPFNEGEKVTVTIKAFVPNKCSGRTILSKVVKIPYYNRFSEEDICKEYPDFKYCSELTETTITLDKFNTEINKYINSLNVEEETEKPNNSWTLLIIIGGVIVGLGLIFVITLIVIRVRKKNSL